jgi:hypothetical protein
VNQYDTRGVPGYVDVVGVANATVTVTVTVNGTATTRKGEYYAAALTVANGSAPQNFSVSATAVNGGSSTSTTQGTIYTPQNVEHFLYDGDGNMTSEGRWTNMVWDWTLPTD